MSDISINTDTRFTLSLELIVNRVPEISENVTTIMNLESMSTLILESDQDINRLMEMELLL